MARRSKEPTQPEIKQFTSLEEIERAIAKLARRMDEVESLERQNVQHDDQRVRNAENNLRSAILEVFGPNSPEYREHQYHQIWEGTMVFGGMDERSLQQGLRDGIVSTRTLLQGLIAALEERKIDFKAARVPAAPEERMQGPRVSDLRDPTKVFIIQGRNQAAANELRKFLFALGLGEWHYEEVARELGNDASVYEIIARGVSGTRAVIALFTPDEHARLQSQFVGPHDKERDKARWQARANVLYEAGLARGLNPEGTILVSFGLVDLPSDLDGIHILRLTNDAARRNDLRERLIRAGCAVNSSDAWMRDGLAGNFAPELVKPRD